VPRALALFAIAPVLAAAFIALDLIVDPSRPPPAEIAIDLAEKTILFALVVVALLIVPKFANIERDTAAMRVDLDRARQDGERWRQNSRLLMTGLAEAIQRQFDDWGLTAAEADIAGLMLNGLPLKGIARLRQTGEATIRQQVQGIYRKSGLANRTALAADFLEDLYDVAAARVASAGLAGDRPVN
jgi:DNA-binding NarL/FixJ family response regulator